MFKALLDAPMREGKEGVVDIQDVRAPVFRTLLHFLYTDSLPEVSHLKTLPLRSLVPLLCSSPCY